MARAIVGVCTIELEIGGMDALKGKRAVIQSLIKRLRNTFNVAAAEIDRLNDIDTAVIAFTTVSNSSQHANQTITHVLNWIDEHAHDVLVTSETVEIL